MFQKTAKRIPVPEYDFVRDGPLVTPEYDPSLTLVESYWTRPGLSQVLIVRTPANEFQYLVFEPSLTLFEKEVLERLFPGVRDLLIRTDVAMDEESRTKALYDAMDLYLERFSIDLTPESVHKIRYYLKRNYLGWGILDPLQQDVEIEDISCDGYTTPLFLYHRRYRNIRTSIRFSTQEELDSVVVRFAQSAGKQISLASPIVDTALTDGSRAQLTYGKTVTSWGSSFTIRKFREIPFSPIDLILNNTFTVEEMVYFWMAVEYSQSILFIGGTASGKTTSLNAVAQFIPHLSKVITIEDTREITLSHENWLSSVVPDVANASDSRGRIEMFDLLKAAMRQRPEYILVGEVRGVEARTLFQDEPLNVPKAMIASLNIVSSQIRMYREGKQIRRCSEIVEIMGISETKDVVVNTVFKYRPDTDGVIYSARSEIYNRIAEISGNDMNWVVREQQRRAVVLTAMVEQQIRDYRDVSEILWRYAAAPELVLSSLDDLTVLLEHGSVTPRPRRNMKADVVPPFV